MKQEIKPLSRGKVLRDMEQWLSGTLRFSMSNETLAAMFEAVVASSSWGTSEYGGPVWLMDFSLDNLKKLFPDNPWLLAMEKEKNQETETRKTDRWFRSKPLDDFCFWFELHAREFITSCGLGNVLLKLERSRFGTLSFYCWGTILGVMQQGVWGYLHRPTEAIMMDWNFSLKESKIVKSGEFLTYLSNGWVDSQRVMRERFPADAKELGIKNFITHSKYGECYKSWGFCSAEGHIIPETSQEKFLILLVSDIMEAEAYLVQNKEKFKNIGLDEKGFDDRYYFYPPMRYDTYIAEEPSTWGHLRVTGSIYLRGGLKIKVDLPKIDAEHGEFWHRQFPLKQHWRTLEDFEN